MAGSATEQSSGQSADVEMAANATEPGLERFLLPPNDSVATSPAQLEIHVEFNRDMWWAMPHVLSDEILERWQSGAEQVSFIWDWGNARQGSYQPHGAATSINRYIIDFTTMRQRNKDNDCTRRIKIVSVVALGSATEQTTNQ